MAHREQPISFLHWHRDGGLVAVARFPAEVPQQQIDTWRERVAANGGATTEVHDPAPALTEDDWAHLRRKMAEARANRTPG
ncbi:hypothetical protein ACF1BP_21620 [Streptomyces sp. NPDC014735]|uniref:hypothetical protein n=1 Tax=Streptomyces sp. NPDC014735 TaxID=3364887 RepID=UPI0036F7D63E